MSLMTIGMLVAGLALLVVGGEFLVRGASRLAAVLGISPLVIGLTVVAFGTSSPELAVSLQAGFSGNPDIAVANVVGSNIFNVLFILGLCAVILPLVVSIQLIRLDVPIMIGSSLLLFALIGFDQKLQWFDGVLLFGLLVAYTAWAIIKSRQETAAAKAEYSQEFGEAPLKVEHSPRFMATQAAFIVGGLVLLAFGSRWLVESATTIARVFNVSDTIIGLTIVAAGTSLPEVAASVIATIRKERDIAIGNVVGSNIFNVLGIAGIAAILTPGGLNVAPAIVSFDLPIMVAVALASLPIFFTGMSIARWEGWVFLGSYVAYTTYLILQATAHDALPMFSSTMLYFVLPLIVLSIGVTAFQALRKNQQTAA